MTGHSVLVVDDDRLSRESLCEVLSERGWQVRDAARGLAALELLAGGSSDLIVSDVDMPDISGFELFSRMQQAHIRQPVVLISARANERLRAEALRIGAAALFDKPVAIAPFTTLIDRLVDQRRTPDSHSF